MTQFGGSRKGKKLLRPRLYVSQGFGPEINRHAYLRKCGLKVVGE